MISRRKLIRASAAGLIAAPCVLRAGRARASGLTITITDDASWSGAPPEMVNALAQVVSDLEAQITLPITINVNVGWGECNTVPVTNPLIGQSSSNYTSASYSSIVAGLTANAITAEAHTAVSNLPGADPSSGAGFQITQALYRALVAPGLAPSRDGSIGFNSSALWFFGTPVAGRYDAYGEIMHEITEVMGRQFFDTAHWAVLNLFNYISANTLATLSQVGSFCYDKINLLHKFNNTGDGGDTFDWIPFNGAGGTNDSFNEINNTGVTNSYSAVDKTLMDVLGWSSPSAGQQTFGIVQ